MTPDNRYTFFFATLLLAIFAVVPTPVCGHGCMTRPNPRGSLSARTDFVQHTIAPHAPVDHFAHFPSGPRSRTPGAGLDAQHKLSLPGGWTPYNPSSRSFRWRAGVCGDAVSGPFEHEKDGRYYYGARVSGSYKQGGTIDLELAINAHHNGYIEAHVCDVSRCPGGDISKECFRRGHCTKLRRARVDKCERKGEKECGPIDKRHPERWYLPCYGYADGSARIRRYGEGGEIRYELPSGLSCERCVLQWYWVSANSCNPPGVRKYFEGPDRPHWGSCKGQGGAVGGFAFRQRDCGGGRTDRKSVPEEYYQCADIRIRPGSSGPSGTSYNAADAFKRGHGAVRDIVLVDGKTRIRSLHSGSRRVRVSKFDRLSVEALVEGNVRQVEFRIGDKKVSVLTGKGKRFYISGRQPNDSPKTWRPPLNKWLTLAAIAGRDRDGVRVYFEG